MDVGEGGLAQGGVEIVHRNFFTMTSLAVSNMFSLSKFNILQYPKNWMEFCRIGSGGIEKEVRSCENVFS